MSYNYLAIAKEYNELVKNACVSIEELHAKAENLLVSEAGVAPDKPAFMYCFNWSSKMTEEQKEELKTYNAAWREHHRQELDVMESKAYTNILTDIKCVEEYKLFNIRCRDIALKLYQQKVYMSLMYYVKTHQEEFSGLKGYYKKVKEKIEKLCPGWSYSCYKDNMSNARIYIKVFDSITLENTIWFYDWSTKEFRTKDLADEQQIAFVEEVDVEDMARQYITALDEYNAIVKDARVKIAALQADFSYYPYDCALLDAKANKDVWSHDIKIFNGVSHDTKYITLGELVEKMQ